jgi:hypothetical protein
MTEVLAYEDRLRRARYLGALADRVFRDECSRLGINVDEAIKSPLMSIIIRQGRVSSVETSNDRPRKK